MIRTGRSYDGPDRWFWGQREPHLDVLAGPSDTHLTLLEREVSKGDHEVRLRKTIREWLTEARHSYDIVLIDSAPGLSVLTECFLREADFYLSPTRRDYISTRGLNFLHEFKQRNPEMGFGDHLVFCHRHLNPGLPRI